MRTPAHCPPSRLRRALAVALAAALPALAAVGCSRAPVLVHQFILEYPAPQFSGRSQVPEAIKVQQFAVAEAFNTTAMLYRPSPYQRQAYVYNRWRISPGPLVTDCLVQDLRHSRLFTAVLTEDSPDRARFRVEGGVTEIQEEDEPGGWQAVLALNVTLLDTNFPAKEVSKRVVFQKSYRAVEPMPEKTPQGLAQGISRAMSRLSQQILADLHRAAQARVAAREPQPQS